MKAYLWSRLFTAIVFTLLTLLVSITGNTAPREIINGKNFNLGPPKENGPVVVQVHFQLNDINEINDEHETFEFSGILTLRWRDARQAFDPKLEGVDQKIYQGDFQFNEISPAWYPQLVLVNGSGLYETQGITLRVNPDGTSTLTEALTAVAKEEFNMRRFPFDHQRLQAIFQVFGFNENEVALQIQPDWEMKKLKVPRIPQWSIQGINFKVEDGLTGYLGPGGKASGFVVGVDVVRESFFISRLVILPLILIVLLSFSVFWMDRSSLGDRINVSFVGILTAVAYILVISDTLPKISYVTLMNAILNLSFITMAATVIINLVVGTYDKMGKATIGDRVDFHCRWVFPLAYFAILILAFVVFFNV